MTRLRYINNMTKGQRGAVAVWFALLLPILLGFAALAFDLTRLHLAKVELQNAADAAALAGARFLTPPPNNSIPYNWSAASDSAMAFAQHNYANGSKIQDANIDTGYWNTQSHVFTVSTTISLNAFDVPAVRARLAISSTENNGPLRLFFAPILGIADPNVQASAIAVIYPSQGGTGAFPFVVPKYMLYKYWDYTTHKPKDQSTVDLGTVYASSGKGANKVDSLTGQWTTFQKNTDATKDSNVPFVDSLITYGSSVSLSKGDFIYVQPGAKATLFGSVDAKAGINGIDVALYVVDYLVKKDTNTYQSIFDVVAFHIDGANQGGKYITGHFIDPASIPGFDPITGTFTTNGTFTTPLLVQ